MLVRQAGHKRLRYLCSASAGACLLLLLANPAQAQFRSLENPSFESNDPLGPGTPNFEIMSSAAVPGWETTTNEVELWDSTFNGVSSYQGNVHAEINANMPGTFYQNICLINGESLGWTFAHRARDGGASTQTVTFQVANSGGTVLQTLTSQSSRTRDQFWNVNTGSRTYSGASGLQRVQFTTSDTGSVGNFLDAIQLTLRPFVQLSAANSTALESASSAGIATLRVTGYSASAFTVTVNINSGTASRGTDYTTPGGGSSFTVTVPAGTYNNTAVPLGITITDDMTLESGETIAFSLGTGTGYTLGNTTTCGAAVQTTGTHTITDNDARVTLRKQWAGANLGDDAVLTLTRGAAIVDTLNSEAATASDRDTDASPTAVVIGETLLLNETLPGTNIGQYNGVLTCTGTSDTDLLDGLTIGTGETAIVCTYTNTRIYELQVSKTSLVWSDGVNNATPMAIPGAVVRYCILVTNPGTVTATNILATDVLPARLTYLPGTSRTGSGCTAATNPEDDNATGADETDPFGVSFSGATITGYAANLAAGASFAISLDAALN